MTQLAPTLDPAFVIGWHVGKAAVDQALAAVPVSGPRVVAEPDLWELNRRIIEHEAVTPMRGHDEDGRCCLLARLEVKSTA